MRQTFLDYIGPADSLYGYQRSYKIILLLAFFKLADGQGKAPTLEVASQFKSFYEGRVQSGLIPDRDVEPRIKNILTSSSQSVLAVIKDNPYDSIHRQGFMDIQTLDGIDYFVINPELNDEIRTEKGDIISLLEKKRDLYFKNIDTNSNLRTIFTQMLDGYLDARLHQPFASNQLGLLLRNQSVDTILNLPFINRSRVTATGSIGQGNWAMVPWISIFNKQVTTSAQSGVYIVYLFSDDGQRLYLTLNQGSTKLLNSLGRPKAMQAMSDTARDTRAAIPARQFVASNDFHVGNIPYEQGTIFYKEYQKGNLPAKEVLEVDLQDMMEIYDEYVEKVFNHPTPIPLPVDKPESTPEGASMNIAAELTRISSYIAGKGFSYPNGIIENFYLSLKTKPFVILAGVSGTGKTRLVKLFAEAMGATAANGRYKLIPVRPDWSDSSDLLGHRDLNGHYVSGLMTGFIADAIANPEFPYFMCLDEMNLARVEYYLSDILSVIETREYINNVIMTNRLIPTEFFGSDLEAVEKYGQLYLPSNVYIVGTVNMDETTFPFSKKVLDRANTIEFSFIDLDLKEISGSTVGPAELPNDFLQSEYLQISQSQDVDGLITEGVIPVLKKINDALIPINAQVGYRVRDEISIYMLYNKRYGLISDPSALDHAILQKILPRIQGSSYAVNLALVDLFKICAAHQQVIQSNNQSCYEQMLDYIRQKATSIPYPKSAEKIAFMMRRLEQDGFTTYWL